MKKSDYHVRSRAVRILAPGLIFLIVLGLEFSIPLPMYAQQGVAPTTIPAGGCAIDGNLLARVPAVTPFSSSNGDFLPNDGAPGTGGAVFTLTGLPLDTAMAFHIIDGYDNADQNIFTGGSKFNGNPNGWHWKSGKPPAKDDINHAMFFFASDASGNLWFVGSGDRMSTNGNTYLDFELFQNPVYKNSDKTFTSTGPDGGRTVGDLAITVWYTNGGTVPTLYIYKWTATSQSTFNYVLVNPVAGTTFLATNKDSAVVVPYGAFGVNTYPKSAFTEVAVNLNDLMAGTNNCMNVKTVLVKTKASQSVNAELKDMVDPVQVSITSAPIISVNDATVCQGDSATLTVTVLSGTGPYTYLWNTGDTTASIIVAPDTTTQYTVVVTGANGCPSLPDTATVTVLPLPVVEIQGPDSICPGTDATLTAVVLSGDGPFTYLWGTGDTTQSITVMPDSTTTYSVVVTGGNGCSSLPAYKTVIVMSPAEVEIAGPDSICVGDTATLTANVLSGTGPFTYLWSTGDTTQSIQVAPDTTTHYSVVIAGLNGCPSEPAYKTVNVLALPLVDITGPDSICLGDTATLAAVVVSGTGPFTYLWSTGETTQTIQVAPVATTQYSVVVTGEIGCQSAPAFFTVTVNPLPICSIAGPDTICPAGTGAFMGPDSLSAYLWTVIGFGTITGNATDQTVEVTGTGSCDSTFTLTLVVTNANGCTSMCSKTVTLIDQIPPEITFVPGNLNLQCALQVPTPEEDTISVADNCAGTLTIVVNDSVTDQTCADRFTLIRTWVVMDLCGNSATASHTISVFDSIPPVLLGVPADTGVCCADSIPAPAPVTAFDTCSGQLPVALTEVVTDSISPSRFVLTRTWTAADSCGNSVSAQQVITVNDSLFPPSNLGIRDGQALIRLSVSPNPFIDNTRLQFSISHDANAVVELYNSMGVLIRTLYKGSVQAGSQMSLILSPNADMVPGMYLLVLRSDYGIRSRHIVMIR